MWRVAMLLSMVPVAAQAEVCDKYEEGMGAIVILSVVPGALLTWVAYLLLSRLGMVLCLLWGVLVVMLTLLADFEIASDPIYRGLWDREPWCRQSMIWFNVMLHAAAPAGVIVPVLLLMRLRRLSLT